MLKLYSYFRSSASYRVRIALELKGLSYETIPVHLLRDGGQHLQPAYRALNPSALVPTLRDGDVTVTQSMAIVEYLEETRPAPPLLPPGAADRARVRALAQMVACEIHPLNNLRVLNYLGSSVGMNDSARQDWYRHWIGVGLASIEQVLATSPQTGACCHRDTPGLADCFLVPQVFNAQRFDADLAAFPTVRKIADHCADLPAFIAAHPSRQPDAE